MPNNVLFTFPGKLGDLLYALPVIREYSRLFDHDIYIETSKYCKPAIPLLISQPYIKNAFIDTDYVCLSNMCGMQPPEMSEPEGYYKIFHLGFRRDIIGSPLSYPHIVDTFAATMEKRYSINLSNWNREEKYIKVPDTTTQNYITFNSYGHAFFMGFKKESPANKRLNYIWMELFKLIKKNKSKKDINSNRTR